MYQHTARRAHGVMIITDPSLSAPVETDTVQCCHCDAHKAHDDWKKEGGFCRYCNGPICGDACAACAPFEKKLDDYEKGKIDKL